MKSFELPKAALPVLTAPKLSRRTLVTGLIGFASANLPKSIFAEAGRYRTTVTSQGAKGDGSTVDTVAIQRAIDICSERGGGVVQFPAGSYVTGTMLVKNNVELLLDQGATILGSLDPQDYRLIEPFVDGVGKTRGYALIGCLDVARVGISGDGVIDGRGAELQAAGGHIPAAKPFLLLCSRSSKVDISGLKLHNSGAWTLHISQCTDVAVVGVSIRSVGLANNDGIDIDSSQRVRVEKCTIESGDDAICLKTTSAAPCRDISVVGCTLTTRCAAFKIGTESAGDFSKVRVSDCHVLEANLGAVKILSVDGANISDVSVENLRVDSADTPIFLRLGSRGRTFRSGAMVRPAGSLTGVSIRDVHVKQARRIGILLAGIPGHDVSDVLLQRIAITMVGDPVKIPISDPPENAAVYPEIRMFGSTLPASGLYCRHARNVKMDHVEIISVPGDTRPEKVCPDT